MGCAQNGVVGRNWTPGCHFPPQIKKVDRGIEGAPAKEIRALVAQFGDSNQPLTFRKLERKADREGKLITPYYIHAIISSQP